MKVSFDPRLIRKNSLGRHACATTAGYMIKYNHTVFKLVPFSDIAIKSVDGIASKFEDYTPKREDVKTNLPGNFVFVLFSLFHSDNGLPLHLGKC